MTDLNYCPAFLSRGKTLRNIISIVVMYTRLYRTFIYSVTNQGLSKHISRKNMILHKLMFAIYFDSIKYYHPTHTSLWQKQYPRGTFTSSVFHTYN